MPIQILMPALSPTMKEGNLAKWHVKVDDVVQPGDVIAEIETDKATMEVEAVDEGKIGKILIAEGTEGVPVNSVIGILLEEGEDASAMDLVLANKGVEKGVTQPEATSNKEASSTKPPEQTDTQSLAPLTSTDIKAPTSIKNERIFASPLARRIASQSNIDLSMLQGTGPRGRIIKADVQRALDSGVTNLGSAVPKPDSSGNALLSIQQPDARAISSAFGPTFAEIPLNNVRKVIAQRLVESKLTVPHFYLTIDCELDALLSLRKQVNASLSDVDKVSINDFIIKASAKALKDVPAANSAWAGDAILQYDTADVAVAVAIDGGLITPIVKSAEDKPMTTIAAEMKDKAVRARNGKLTPEEYQGGSFSISNLGMMGIKHFCAVINPPHGAILAVGAGEKRPVVKEGELAIATLMTCTLSCDHRVVDGAVGASFLAVFKKYIENPVSMLV